MVFENILNSYINKCAFLQDDEEARFKDLRWQVGDGGRPKTPWPVLWVQHSTGLIRVVMTSTMTLLESKDYSNLDTRSLPETSVKMAPETLLYTGLTAGKI